MADKKLSQVIGSSGAINTKFASNLIEVAFGATGTYVTLTPPAGQRVILTALGSSGSTQTNLTTVSVGGNNVVTDALLAQINTSPDVDELVIGLGSPTQEPIVGDVDEVLEISTNVATSQGTFYSYQYGE